MFPKEETDHSAPNNLVLYCCFYFYFFTVDSIVRTSSQLAKKFVRVNMREDKKKKRIARCILQCKVLSV